MNSKVRIIAQYLPQYHQIPENDKWWGKGFTDWSFVKKSKPLFKGHYQPRIPSELGYYDLLNPDIRQAQADMAKKYGIEGFCYWHYWFGNGKRLLETPFNEVLVSKEPDFPFCLAWANHSWKQKFHVFGSKSKLLIEQKYLGAEDYSTHFNTLLSAFKDKRYITIDGKPVFMIFSPLTFPEISLFIQIWQNLALENGLPGIYFIGQGKKNQRELVLRLGFDAFHDVSISAIYFKQNLLRRFLIKLKVKLLKTPRVYQYNEAMKYFCNNEMQALNTIPTICPNWDHSPRSEYKGFILHDSTPELFKKHVKEVLSHIIEKPIDHRIAIIKSWNEWGEGNYMEPDQKFGFGYLIALKEAIEEKVRNKCA